jgi:hypothetical protein
VKSEVSKHQDRPSSRLTGGSRSKGLGGKALKYLCGAEDETDEDLKNILDPDR